MGDEFSDIGDGRPSMVDGGLDMVEEVGDSQVRYLL